MSPSFIIFSKTTTKGLTYFKERAKKAISNESDYAIKKAFSQIPKVQKSRPFRERLSSRSFANALP
jgi:hypothetical protein